MAYNVLVTCKNNTRDQAISKIKEFKDVKNIQQRKNPDELLLEIDSNDISYVKNNVVKRMQDIQEISNTQIVS